MFSEPNWPLFRDQEVMKAQWNDIDAAAEKFQRWIAICQSGGPGEGITVG